MIIGRVLARALIALGVLGCAAPAVMAQSAENVAVIINDNSDDSRRIGEHYAKTRGLPPSNVFRIQTTVDEAIDRAAYARTIETPLRAAISRGGLQDRLLYLVLTKGIPLRIAGTRGSNGTAASVDSELTLLYRSLVGAPAPVAGRIGNPYYLGSRPIGEARPFSHREHDIYLVSRLDAFTVEQAIALIDRAQAPSTQGRIVFDQRGTGGAIEEWMASAAKRLSEQGHASRVVLENTPKLAQESAPVLGYSSWGASDPANRARNPGLRFAPGSIGVNLASNEARTLRQPPETWRPYGSSDKTSWFEGAPDGLIGDLIRQGMTGVAGQVDEAFAFGAVRPEILFPAYLAGYNLVEAFYLAMPTLSWQAVVVGDPLCAPFSRKPLSRSELEEPVDPASGYPGLFARRRSTFMLAVDRELSPAAAPALLRSQRLLELGDRANARRALEEVVKLAPRSVGSLLALAQLEEEAGEVDTAIARYRRIVAELQPTNVVALNNLAYALAVRRNAPAEALPFAQAALKQAPLAGTVLDTLGWVQHLLGNEELAAKMLTEAVKREPAQPEIRLHAAFVLLAVGNVAGAEAELKEALRLDPKLEKRDDVQRLRQQPRR